MDIVERFTAYIIERFTAYSVRVVSNGLLGDLNIFK
jgi:hypothetical protein